MLFLATLMLPICMYKQHVKIDMKLQNVANHLIKILTRGSLYFHIEPGWFA